MPALPAPEVALLLREFGQRTALRGGNPYRSKAYTRAAENLLALTEPLEDLVAEGRLTEIPGVGDAIADIITKLHKTGDHPSLQSMRKEMPADALEMLSIPGLRPDKVLKIYRELPVAMITSTLRLTNSAATSASRSRRLSPYRSSNRTFPLNPAEPAERLSLTGKNLGSGGCCRYIANSV
jgi:DNA polymerase/3'-5' exonuclease PolX